MKAGTRHLCLHFLRSYWRAPHQGFITIQTESRLRHETTLQDGSVVSCTGSIELPVNTKTLAADPVFCSLLQMNKDHNHSSRIPTKILKKAMGTKAVRLVGSDEVFKKACTMVGGYSVEEHVEGFRLIESWLSLLQEGNEGLLADVQRFETDNTLKHVSVVLPYALKAAPYLLRMYCLDGAHMKPIVVSMTPKTRLAKFFIIGLAGRTASNGMLPLAFLLCRSESYEGGYKTLMSALPPELLAWMNNPLTVVSCNGGAAELKPFQEGHEVDNVTLQRFGKHLEDNLTSHGGSSIEQ